MVKGGSCSSPHGESFYSKLNFSCLHILGASVTFMKDIFQIGPTVLTLKLDKKRVLEGVATMSPPPSHGLKIDLFF